MNILILSGADAEHPPSGAKSDDFTTFQEKLGNQYILHHLGYLVSHMLFEKGLN